MKRSAILLCDIIVLFIVYEWSLLGPWDHLLGFSVYHSRGDVWLPTPPAAASFFRAMVSTGNLLFATFFLLTSLILFLGRSRGVSPDEREGNLYPIFYGNLRKLSVKYSALLLISFISPFFYSYMWRFRVTRVGRIAGGLAITIGTFIVILTIGELVARIARGRSQALRL